MTQLIEYNVTQAAIAELTKEKEVLLSASELDYKAIKDAKNRNGKIRIAIEKTRKDLKSDALAYGKKIDNKAKEVSEPVTAIEDAYKDILNKHEAELEDVRVAALHKENERIAAIKSHIEKVHEFSDLIVVGLSSKDIMSIQKDLLSYDDNSAVDCQEFQGDYEKAISRAHEIIDDMYDNRLMIEKEKAEQAEQRKKDNEARIALQAEKDAFEQEQKDAQAKIDFERAAIQKEKDDLQLAESEREEKKQQAIHEEKMREAKEQLAKQRAIDEDARKKAAETERLRLEQVAKEEAERKVSQAAEDNVRNAAPELLEALECAENYFTFMKEIVNDSCAEHRAEMVETRSCGGQTLDELFEAYKQKAKLAIKLAKGE